MTEVKPPARTANRAHDMGGQPGGALPMDPPDQPVFAQSWHARALAITIAAGALGKWTLDESRHARERLPATDYLAYSYYEKWLAGLATLLVDHDLVTTDELRAGHALVQVADTGTPHLPPSADQLEAALHRGSPSVRPARTPPRYLYGQQVQTLCPDAAARRPGGHTRLPAYVAGHTGLIIRHHGSHVLPDSNAHGLGEQPEHLYGVCFKASDLWPDRGPDRAGIDDQVCLDLWESYLIVADG